MIRNRFKFIILLLFINFYCSSVTAKNSYEYFSSIKQSTSYCLSHNNNYLLIAKNSDIEIWDINHKKKIKTIQAYKDNVKDLVVYDEKYFYSLNQSGDVKKWNLTKGKFISQLKVENASGLSLFNETLFVIAELGVFKVDLNLKTKFKFINFKFSDFFIIDDFKFTDKFFYLLSSSGLYIYSIETSKIYAQYKLTGISSFEVFNDSKIILGMMENGNIRIISFNNMKLINKFKAHLHHVQVISVSNKKRFIASSGEIGTIKIWNTKNFKLVKEIPAHKETVIQLQFSKDDKYLYVLGDDVRRYKLNLDKILKNNKKIIKK